MITNVAHLFLIIPLVAQSIYTLVFQSVVVGHCLNICRKAVASPVFLCHHVWIIVIGSQFGLSLCLYVHGIKTVC